MRLSPLLLISTLIAPPFALAQTPDTATQTLPTATPLPSPSPAATPQVTPKPAPRSVLKGRLIVPTGAVSFTSKAQGFAVWLPGKPVEEQHTSMMPTGENMVTTTFLVRTISAGYGIAAARFPPKFAALVAKDPAQQMQVLDGVHVGIIGALDSKGLGPHLQKQEDLHLGNFPGRDIKVSYFKGAATLRARYFLTARGIYSISAGGPKAEMQQQEGQIDRIFDSLRILP